MAVFLPQICPAPKRKMQVTGKIFHINQSYKQKKRAKKPSLFSATPAGGYFHNPSIAARSSAVSWPSSAIWASYRCGFQMVKYSP